MDYKSSLSILKKLSAILESNQQRKEVISYSNF